MAFDTSDRALYIAGADVSTGSSLYVVGVADTRAKLDNTIDVRSNIIITNTGDKVVFLSFSDNPSDDVYTMRLKPKAFVSVSGFGGTITAICNLGESTELYISDIH